MLISTKLIKTKIRYAYPLAGKFETKVLNKFKASIIDLTNHFSFQFDQIKQLEKNRTIEVDLLFWLVKLKKNKEKEKEPNDNLNETLSQKIKLHEEKLEKINSDILILREKLNEEIDKHMAYDIDNIYNLAKKAMQKEIKMENKVQGYDLITSLQNDVENIIVHMSDLEQKKLKIDSERENLHDRSFRQDEYTNICQQIEECRNCVKNRKILIIQIATKLSNPFRSSIEKEEALFENPPLQQDVLITKTF